MNERLKPWSIIDADDLYQVDRWGAGYFRIGQNGQLHVHPEKDATRSIDLKQLIDRLQLQGLQLPILLRFNGIVKDRLRQLHNVFQHAISEHDYKGRYICVYPIKVNQQRHIVEQVLEAGREYQFGLEAGSKPEMLAVIAMTDSRTPVICNGFKDAEFIEMALLAQKIGRPVIPVVERMAELDLILDIAERIGVRPRLGVRMKLASAGAGRWQASGGYRSKFGLNVGEILQVVDQLIARDMGDCLKLLHFHLGSQITNIRPVKNALNEATRVYVEIARRGAGLEYLDVGGGLGVDYDGSQSNFDSSVNYTLQEYANDVVYHIQTVCDDAGVPHPHIISESGRAVAAYHSVLVFGVLGVTHHGTDGQIPQELDPEYEQPLHDLLMTLHGLTVRNMREAFHDAQQALDMAMNLFSAGYLPLDQRELAERMFFAICRRIRDLAQTLDEVPQEFSGLDQMLAHTYFCNFSLFQSMPDSWAVKQLFPVMPIHRLDEEPRQHAVLGDVTCDSDGKINRFISGRDVQKSIVLHRWSGEPYYLGAFLVGAYQEILGDLHNLFGDTNAAHVSLNEDGQLVIDTIIRGDTVNRVLDYVQIDGKELIHRLQVAVDLAIREQRIDTQQAGDFISFFEQSLNGYTYLEETPAPR